MESIRNILLRLNSLEQILKRENIQNDDIDFEIRWIKNIIENEVLTKNSNLEYELKETEKVKALIQYLKEEEVKENE